MTSTLMNGISPENIGANGTVRNAVKQPYIEIVEQPASKALRFRYECEGRSAGSIPGVHNTPEHKTYPTVRIVGFKGPAVIIVSCVTKDEPYRAHPHNLVGKENCRDGICTMEINNDSMTATFSNLGIQCVKKKDIEDALRIREEKRVDPFRQGFAHSANASSIDLNAVRLSFQAFLRGSEPKKYQVLTPVVSDVIYDKKAMSDLVITKLSHSSAPALSRQEMILLCEKVAKEDIQIRFFEERNNEVVWEATGDFTPTQVHKQVAIWFKTPQYPGISEMEGSVNVFIQLKRPSDNAVSEPLPFKFRPEDPGKHAFWLLRSLKPDFDVLAKILVDLNHPLTKEILALRRSSSPVTRLNADETKRATRPSKHFCRSEVTSDDEDDDESEDEDDEEERMTSESTDKDEKEANDGEGGAGEALSRATPSANEKSLRDAIDDLSTVTPDKLSELGLVFSDTEEVACELVESASASPVAEQAATKETTVSRRQAGRLHSSLHMAMKNTIKIPERIAFGGRSKAARDYEPMAPPPRPPAASKPNFEKGPSVANEPLPPLPPKRVKRNSFLNQSLPALPQKESRLAFLEKLWPSKRKKKKTQAANENDDVSQQSCRSLDYRPPNGVDDDFVTEAENYALYTSVAPRATDSEFDDTSCYYSPVE